MGSKAKVIGKPAESIIDRTFNPNSPSSSVVWQFGDAGSQQLRLDRLYCRETMPYLDTRCTKPGISTAKASKGFDWGNKLMAPDFFGGIGLYLL